jgi:flagellar hook-basal body complex protein FliE
MSVAALNQFNSLTPAGAGPSAGAAGGPSSSGSFGDAVRQAVDALDTRQKGAEQEIARAVSGQSPDLHRTVIELQTADLGFQFALQVRNKLVGAYEEIMRMQV